MKLTSMKMAKKEKSNSPQPESEQPEFPWGLRITLETEQIAKLGGLKGCEVGEDAGIQASSKIISIRKEESKGDKNRHTIEIQITALDISFDADYEKGFDEASKKGG